MVDASAPYVALTKVKGVPQLLMEIDDKPAKFYPITTEGGAKFQQDLKATGKNQIMISSTIDFCEEYDVSRQQLVDYFNIVSASWAN